MMNRLRNFLPALLLIAACNNAPEQTSENKPEPDKTVTETLPDSLQFAAFYKAFDADIRNSGNLEQLKKYVNTEQGLWIVDANGAMPGFTHYTLLNTAVFSGSIKIVPIKNEPCELKIETLPLVDCDKPTLYSKDGCFAQKINTFAQHKIWLSAGLQTEERAAVEKLANAIDYTVIQTSGYRYYFSKIGNNWYISFIDLRRPCGA
ncbi:MAG: hypothetical protein ACRC3B_09300 [Bacteroidia bacterium]